MLMLQSVGVSGHVLHGGFGMASNTHGLALDWVIGITVVLANSTVVECSANQHPDLFWAMLGAGSNFGIAASYQFKTFEAPANVTWFSAQLPWNQSTAQAGLEALESYAKNAMPAELNMRLAGSSHSASVEGVYYGDKEGLEAALEPLLNKTGGSISGAKTGGWMDGIEHYANAEVDVTYLYEMVSIAFRFHCSSDCSIA
jgi:FAD/FMN-containing dehydrogenase